MFTDKDEKQSHEQPSPAQKLELRCPLHPAYRAIRKPRVKCALCDELYVIWHTTKEEKPTLFRRIENWLRN